MDKAICGILKDKCRILATHQLHVLNRCDRIIWIEDGCIASIDTFDNLMRNSEGFQKLMATTAQEEDTSQGPKSDSKEKAEEKQDAKKSKRSKAAGALMTQEERAVKSVGWNVWKAYIEASGSIFNAPLILLILVAANGANICTSLWLSFWTSNKFHYSEGAYIGVYVALGFSQALLMYIFSTLLSTSGTNASKSMLQRAMTRVLRAPMSFFDTTPLGRITNRFSKDIDSMDNNLTDAMRMYFLTLTMILSVFALIIAYFHYVSFLPRALLSIQADHCSSSPLLLDLYTFCSCLLQAIIAPQLEKSNDTSLFYDRTSLLVLAKRFPERRLLERMVCRNILRNAFVIQ